MLVQHHAPLVHVDVFEPGARFEPLAIRNAPLHAHAAAAVHRAEEGIGQSLEPTRHGGHAPLREKMRGHLVTVSSPIASDVCDVVVDQLARQRRTRPVDFGARHERRFRRARRAAQPLPHGEKCRATEGRQHRPLLKNVSIGDAHGFIYQMVATSLPLLGDPSNGRNGGLKAPRDPSTPLKWVKMEFSRPYGVRSPSGHGLRNCLPFGRYASGAEVRLRRCSLGLDSVDGMAAARLERRESEDKRRRHALGGDFGTLLTAARHVLPALVRTRVSRHPTLLGLALGHADRNPDRLALEAEDERLTWSDVATLSSKVARVLADAGVRKGDIVALMGRSSPRYVVLTLAATRVGATMALINPHLSGGPLAHAFATSGARIALVDEPFRDRVTREHVHGGRLILYGTPASELERLLAQIDETSFPPARMSGDDDFVYIYTSGTTGLPKPCRISHSRATLAGALVRVADVRIRARRQIVRAAAAFIIPTVCSSRPARASRWACRWPCASNSARASFSKMFAATTQRR